MAHKHLLVQSAAREKILHGALALADAVRVTLGPKSKCVLIEKKWSRPIVCNDGVTIAKESDARLTIAHVFEWPSDDDLVAEQAFDVPEYRRQREEQTRQQLEALVSADERNWCQPTTMLSYGKPYERILGIAENEEADLIVMGVHGRNVLDLMLFGSTTNQVVRRALCPVLTLRH